jgi:hypothetical protein
MSKIEFENRIAELIAKGYSPRTAERVAKRERRLRNLQHKAAVARRLAAADARFERTGNADAYKAV